MEVNETRQIPKSTMGGGKILLLIVLIAIFLFGAFYLFSSYLIKKEDEKFINVVREGTFENHPEKKIGEAFEDYFEDGEWSHWESKGHNVEFRGYCEIEGKTTSTVIWFKVEDDLSGFELNGGSVGTNPKWLEIEHVISSVYTGVDITEANYGYTMEEYIARCTVVETETIARNPNAYIGQDILIEGSIGNTFGVYSIGLWSTANPITVEYDGVAYDLELNPLGNILNGDYGFVAGEYIGNDTISAEIIVVYDDRYEDSYMQIINSVSGAGQEYEANISNDMYDLYDYFRYVNGKYPQAFFENMGIDYETDPYPRGCSYYSSDWSIGFISDADSGEECFISGAASEQYGVTLCGVYTGMDREYFYECIGEEWKIFEYNGTLERVIEDDKGEVSVFITFSQGKVSEVRAYDR